MASYKVPQDVEADDKLIGPFSFRQFIYLIIVAMAIALGWALAQLFIPLAIIVLPVVVFFGALALPLRKDQPMEIYMAAIVSYYLKPHLRKWDPEGVETLIEIAAPKTVEVQRTKDLTQYEARERLSYLANIVDTGGWAIRGVQAPLGATSSVTNDVYMEAQGVTDVLDTNTAVAHTIDQMMNQSAARMHEQAKERMMAAAAASEPVLAPAPAPTIIPQQPVAPAVPQKPYQAPQPVRTPQQTYQIPDQPQPEPQHLEYNPYPTFHQSIIQPLNDVAHEAKDDIVEPVAPEPQKATSDNPIAPDIMNLANNPDFSIETIAHEAERIQKKAETKPSDEVFISLR
jgi:hypothetical protein